MIWDRRDEKNIQLATIVMGLFEDIDDTDVATATALMANHRLCLDLIPFCIDYQLNSIEFGADD